jgi:lysophospholipase L1-like esterase
LVYLHASKHECEVGKYEKQGKKIKAICKKNEVEIIEDLKSLQKCPEAFLDDIHLNETGHQIMAEILMPYLVKYIRISL